MTSTLESRAKGDFLYGSEYDRVPLLMGEPMPDWMAQALGLQDYPEICDQATYRESNQNRTTFDIRWDDCGVRLLVKNGTAYWTAPLDGVRVRPVERDEALALLMADTKL